MFLFESSKQKQIRLGVQKNMQICISNPKKYNQAKEALVGHIRGSDQNVIEMIVDNIKATIKNQDLQPIRKYQAMLLLKDLMLTYNKALGKYVVKKILKRLTILAMHKSGSNDDREEERGKDIFGSVKRDQQVYAVQFFTTLLTALEQWGKNWPKAPDGPNKDFQRQYNQLLMNGVQFPKQRPKQTSKSPIKVLRQESKTPQAINPSASPNRVSIDKPKPKVSVDKKDNPRRSCVGKSNQLKLELSQFYEKIAQSFLFLQQILQSGSLQQLQTIKDSIALIQKQIQKGNQYVISMQDLQECENDQIKIESMFSFMEKIQKDLKILNKKPQQFIVFQNKYLKLTKRTLQILTNKNTGKKDKPAPNEKAQNIATPNTSSIKTQGKQISQLDLQKRQEPKIKNNQNRYVSVTGEQVLQQFNKESKANQFQSHSGNSASDRFGSFGGLPGITERPKNVISMSPANPYQNNNDKIDTKSEHNNQSPEINQKDGVKFTYELPIRSMPQTGTGVRDHSKPSSQSSINRNKQEQKNDATNQINNSNNFFQQFQKNQSKPDKQIGIIKKKSSKQDEFTGQNFPKNQRDSSQDFFSKIESKPQGVSDVSKISRRKINAVTHEDPQNVFNNIPSKIDSQGLSAFSFPNPASARAVPQGGQTKNASKNNSKKDVVLDDGPFNIETFPRVSETSEHNASNFFEQFQKKPGSDFLKNSNRSNFFADDRVWEKGQSGVNRFQTGNFVNLKSKQPQKNSQAGSVKSRQSKDQPFQNPFQQNSFQIKSKNSQDSKGQKYNFANPLETDNPFAFNSARGINPISSKAAQSDNPFSSQPLEQNQNPFQTSSHPSQQNNQNPFDEVQQFYKPPQDKAVKDRLTKRSSLENKGQVMAQQVRDSLVLAANLNQSEVGLNFSQFADIGANNGIQKQNPFQSDGSQKQGSNHEKSSGFSLSNFPGIGEQPVRIFQNQNSSHDIQNFFSQFEKPSIISRESRKQLPDLKQQDNFFEGFNVGDKPVQKKQRADNLVQKQKTVVSRDSKSQKSDKSKSFNFDQLDNVSLTKQQKSRKPSIGFDDFLNMSKQNVRSIKQNIELNNEKQKELSWGDFDRNTPKNSLQNVQKRSSDSHSRIDKNLNQKSFQVKPSSNQQLVQRKQLLVLSNKNAQEQRNQSSASVNLNIGDFTPLGKKGQQWNPLLKYKNAKAASFYYNVDDKKIAIKKAELQLVQKNYKEKVNIFKSAKLKNEEVRNHLLQKMKKLNAVIHQKQEYEQILKKIQETNQIKEKQISQIHSKIKRTEDIKNKILMKERKLFEITKVQIHKEERKSTPQRTMSSKWQMFNKNLEYQRNLSYTSISRFSQG